MRVGNKAKMSELKKAIKFFKKNGLGRPGFEMLVIYFLGEILTELHSIKNRKGRKSKKLKNGNH